MVAHPGTAKLIITMGFKQLAAQGRELVSSQVAFTLCRLHEGPLGIKQMTHDRRQRNLDTEMAMADRSGHETGLAKDGELAGWQLAGWRGGRGAGDRSGCR